MISFFKFQYKNNCQKKKEEMEEKEKETCKMCCILLKNYNINK